MHFNADVVVSALSKLSRQLSCQVFDISVFVCLQPQVFWAPKSDIFSFRLLPEMTYSGVCRLCLCGTHNLVGLIQSDESFCEKVQKYLDIDVRLFSSFCVLRLCIQFITSSGVQVSSDDRIISNVCRKCVDRVEDFHQFYVRTAQNQQLLSSSQAIIHESDADKMEKTIVIVGSEHSALIEIPFSHLSQHQTVEVISDEIIQMEQISVQTVSAMDNFDSHFEEINEEYCDDGEEVDEREVEADNCEEIELDEQKFSEFPECLIKDAKLIVHGKELVELMSRFYRLECDICSSHKNSPT